MVFVTETLFGCAPFASSSYDELIEKITSNDEIHVCSYDVVVSTVYDYLQYRIFPIISRPFLHQKSLKKWGSTYAINVKDLSRYLISGLFGTGSLRQN